MPPNTQLPEDCPAWLAQWIGKNDERLHNIEETLGRFETTLVRLAKRSAQKVNPAPKSNDSNKITFKWVVEKLAVPGMFLLAGYLIARGG